jgi:uncharacterized protein involved in outer membrane biogenesis
VRRRKGLAKTIFFSLIAGLVIAVGLLHVVPLRSISVKIEQSLSAWLHDDVSIASLTFRLVPTPHLRVENVAVGKLLDAKAASGQIYLDLATLFSEHVSINSIELDNVTLSNEAVHRIPKWGATQGKSSVGAIDSIRLRAVKLELKPDIGVFDANLQFGRNGELKTARVTGGNWNATFKPAEGGAVDVEFNARHWVPPMGFQADISDAQLKGTISGSQLVVPEFEASALEGKVNGTLKVDWSSDVKLESDLSLAKVDVSQVVGAFTKDISVTGKLDGNFSIAAEGPTVDTLFQAPRAQGRFRIADGSVSNIDLVAVMQSDAAGQRAGVTKFIELTGEYAGLEHRASYKQFALQSGVLRGNGALEIGTNSGLAGHLALEIRSQVAQDRGSFSVSGTVGRPIVKRGG